MSGAAGGAAAGAPPPAEPLRPLLDAVPAGLVVVADRLDCGGSFLLPLLARAAAAGGHKARRGRGGAAVPAGSAAASRGRVGNANPPLMPAGGD
jgi:hypothetical protein